MMTIVPAREIPSSAVARLRALTHERTLAEMTESNCGEMHRVMRRCIYALANLSVASRVWRSSRMLERIVRSAILGRLCHLRLANDSLFWKPRPRDTLDRWREVAAATRRAQIHC